MTIMFTNIGLHFNTSLNIKMCTVIKNTHLHIGENNTEFFNFIKFAYSFNNYSFFVHLITTVDVPTFKSAAIDATKSCVCTVSIVNITFHLD